jgi:zinc D-Ala-D-Ala dipeptidase
VDDFAAWARQPHELAMQPWFYPQVLKAVLFRQGYIAEKSGHSRGSTVDLTLVPVDSPQQPTQKHLAEVSADCRFPKHFRFRDESLDMGTAFDCFDPLSHTENTRISREARYNRLYLKQRMEAHGFRNLPEEWWHYTLVDEPFPNQYFNFPME